MIEDHLEEQEVEEAVAAREYAATCLDRGDMPAPLGRRPVFLSGHFPPAFRGALQGSSVTICSVRHPVDLVISYFFYLRDRQVIPAETTLDAFLETRAVAGVINMQARMIAGIDFPHFPRDPSLFQERLDAGARAALAASLSAPRLRATALENAEAFDLIVDAADLATGVARLSEAFGWPTLPGLRRDNTGKYDRAAVSPAARATIAELCRLDIDVYEAIRRRPMKLRAPRRRAPPRTTLPLLWNPALPLARDARGLFWRDYVPSWGFCRWTDGRATLPVRLRLARRRTYRLALAAMNTIDARNIGALTVTLGPFVLSPEWQCDNTAWRGAAELRTGETGVEIREIVVDCPYPARPSDVMPTDDDRLLGLHLKALSLHASGA